MQFYSLQATVSAGVSLVFLKARGVILALDIGGRFVVYDNLVDVARKVGRTRVRRLCIGHYHKAINIYAASTLDWKYCIAPLIRCYRIVGENPELFRLSILTSTVFAFTQTNEHNATTYRLIDEHVYVLSLWRKFEGLF